MDVSRAPEGTEVRGIFQHEKNVNSSKEGFFNQPGVWAYKASRESGRLVVTGSHPEDAASGDILNLTASMQKPDRIDPPGYPCIEFIAGPL